jgi:transposase
VRNKRLLFIEFLKRLITGQSQSFFLIVDGHPVHKAKKVKEFVKSTEGKIELFYLPGYSPELNPDELVRNHVKHHAIGKKVITGSEQLKTLAVSALRRLVRLPDIILGFFKAPELRFYATQLMKELVNGLCRFIFRIPRGGSGSPRLRAIRCPAFPLSPI